MQLRLAYSCTNLSGRSKELLRASITEFDASLMNPSYSNCRRRSSSTARSRMNWLRWVIQVVKIEPEAPARDPNRAAAAVIIDESIAPLFSVAARHRSVVNDALDLSLGGDPGRRSAASERRSSPPDFPSPRLRYDCINQELAHQDDRNRCLSICKLRIRDSRVDRGIPSFKAA